MKIQIDGGSWTIFFASSFIFHYVSIFLFGIQNKNVVMSKLRPFQILHASRFKSETFWLAFQYPTTKSFLPNLNGVRH